MSIIKYIFFHIKGLKMNSKLFKPTLILILSLFLMNGCGKKEREVKSIQKDSTKQQKQVPIDSSKNEKLTEPLVFTKEQEKMFLKTKKEPYILGLKKALNQYIKGIKSDCVDEFAIVKDNSRKEQNGLSSFDKEYFKSKFYVMSVESNIMGGINLNVMFEYKFDKMFSVWMYKIQQCYSLRSIYVLDYHPKELMKMKNLYKNFLDDKRFAN